MEEIISNEISLNEFLAHFSYNIRSDKRFCFILGAGASWSSGIPTGGELVNTWIKELREINEENLNRWLGENKISEKNDYAVNYPKIFDKRYFINKKDGFAFLENQMSAKNPSCGYSALAQILAQGTNNIVITTNFDSLIEDALFIYTQKKPLVIGHSALADYITTNPTRPLIVKIHHDLLLSPKNSEKEVNKLDTKFSENIKDILKCYTPIVIGYGGNDGSLMNFLESLEKIEGGIFWFYYGPAGKPNERICKLVNKFNGFLIPIKGFDDLMMQIANRLKLERLDDKIIEIAKERAQKYREQMDKLTTEKTVDEETKSAVCDIVSRGNKNWWSFQLEASKEKNVEKRNAIYLEGIKEFPDSHGLVENYANFLKDVLKDYNKAEEYYKKALELAPNDAINNGNYALFLENIRKDYDKAEEYYKKALELDPNHFYTNGNYAVFLHIIRKDYNKAEEFYKKSIEFGPNQAVYVGDYALFLNSIRKDYDKAEEYYKKALELDPNNAINNGNYASFLSNILKDYDRAEEYYKKALELDPNHINNNERYAIFLENIRKDYDKAEEYYKKALKLDPNNLLNNMNYATFLENTRKNYIKSEEYYKKALELDPNDVNNIGRYVIFLENIKKDYDRAEEYCKKALELAPNNTLNNGNYALFLENIRKDYDKAEEYYKKALELDPNNALNNGNYAIFLENIRKDYDRAEEYYKKALELDPNNVLNNGNYAIFLNNIRKDYDKAEEYYKKALELDPDHVNNNESYAVFLSDIRKENNKAEEYYKKALELDPGNANNNGNYAKLLIVKQEYEKAKEYIQEAFELNKVENEQSLSLELWFYCYAIFSDCFPESEEKIQELLDKGVQSVGWNLREVLEIAKEKGHPNFEKLREFEKRITTPKE